MSKLILGLNPPISNAEYHGDNAYLSSSSLKMVLTDIERFHREKILGIKPEERSSPALEEGSYAHSLILEPDKVAEEYAFFPGSIKRGAEFQKFKTDNPGKIIISEVQDARTKALIEAYHRRPEAVELFKGGEAEQTICAMIKGVPIKVRFDYVNVDKGYIADVKTSGFPVDADSFRLTIDKYAYDLSAALYTMVAEEYYHKQFRFYFVCLSKEDLSCEVFYASDDTLRAGRSKVYEAIEKYKKCLKTNVWKDEESTTAQELTDYEILPI